MPSARINTKRWAISGRGEGALLAWELRSRGKVVGEVVVHGGVVGGSSGVYRQRRGGGNNKYTSIIQYINMT